MRRYSGLGALLIFMAAAAWFAIGDKQAPQRNECQDRGNCRTEKRDTAPVPTSTGGFDFYVLALSWSPTYCSSDEGSGNRQQCGTDKDYGFIVHGLWPQNERGYPESCDSREPERVPDSLGRSLFDIMPSMGLIGHQWRKHGTCSRLSQADYFKTLRAAWNRLSIPADLRRPQTSKRLSGDEIVRKMTAANAGLGKDAIALTCNDGQLDEIRICFTKDLKFRDCAGAGRQSCRKNTVTLPAAP